MSAKVYKIIDKGWTYSSIFYNRGASSIKKDQWALIPKELRADIEYHDDAEMPKMPEHKFPYHMIMAFKHHKDPDFYLLQYGYDERDWVFVGKEGIRTYTKQFAIRSMFRGKVAVG